MAFGAYFAYASLLNAQRDALQSRFAISAQRVQSAAELASSFGITLSGQATLAPLLLREASLDPAVRAFDVSDSAGAVLFSSVNGRGGTAAAPADTHTVSRPIRNDLGVVIGATTIYYDAALERMGAQRLADAMRAAALPAVVLACVAALLAGFALLHRLQGAARAAGDPATWPLAARQARADLQVALLRAEGQP